MILLLEIQTGPLAATLAPLVNANNDIAIAEALNAKNYTKLSSVTRNIFLIWAASTGMRATIEDHAANPSSPLRSSALSLKDILSDTASSIDFGIDGNVTMLEAWQAAGAITSQQKLDLLTLATIPASRADIVLGRPTSPAEVSLALRG